MLPVTEGPAREAPVPARAAVADELPAAAEEPPAWELADGARGGLLRVVRWLGVLLESAVAKLTGRGRRRSSVVVYGTYGTYGTVRYVRYEGLRSYHISNFIFDLATYMKCSLPIAA